MPHADPARLPGAVRVLGRDEHEPGCDDVGQARHGRVVGPELLLGRHRGGVVAAVVEGAEQRRGRRSRRSRPARPRRAASTKRPSRARGARRRPDRAQLGRVDPDAVHAVRRRAAGPVVLGPHRIVVSPEVAAVAAIVVPIVGRALVVLITRGPHRCESNDATPDRDRARGAAPTPRTEDRSGFLDCRRARTAPRPESRDWIALTPEPLPSDAALAWASTPAAGAVVSFLGHRPRPRRRARRRRRDDLRGVRGAGPSGAWARSSPTPRAPLVRPRARRAAAPRRRARDFRSRRSLVVVSCSASRRGVRRGALLHRHAQGDRADLEAGALVGRIRLGRRTAPHSSGSSPLAGSKRSRRPVAFLLFAIAASAIGIVIVLLRNRRPIVDGAQHRRVRARSACAGARVPVAARRGPKSKDRRPASRPRDRPRHRQHARLRARAAASSSTSRRSSRSTAARRTCSRWGTRRGR